MCESGLAGTGLIWTGRLCALNLGFAGPEVGSFGFEGESGYCGSLPSV